MLGAPLAPGAGPPMSSVPSKLAKATKRPFADTVAAGAFDCGQNPHPPGPLAPPTRMSAESTLIRSMVWPQLCAPVHNTQAINAHAIRLFPVTMTFSSIERDLVWRFGFFGWTQRTTTRQGGKNTRPAPRQERTRGAGIMRPPFRIGSIDFDAE